MRTVTALALALALAACGGSSKQTPTPPGPPQGDPAANTCGLAEPGVPTTAEQCECLGFLVVGDIGNGQVACPDGATEVAKIQYGIEGGVCCDTAAAAPTGE